MQNLNPKRKQFCLANSNSESIAKPSPKNQTPNPKRESFRLAKSETRKEDVAWQTPAKRRHWLAPPRQDRGGGKPHTPPCKLHIPKERVDWQTPIPNIGKLQTILGYTPTTTNLSQNKMSYWQATRNLKTILLLDILQIPQEDAAWRLGKTQHKIVGGKPHNQNLQPQTLIDKNSWLANQKCYEKILLQCCLLQWNILGGKPETLKKKPIPNRLVGKHETLKVVTVGNNQTLKRIDKPLSRKKKHIGWQALTLKRVILLGTPKPQSLDPKP